ncbi:uncharacterized protein IAS62_000781 [Cryptococcus decagattii]|uniref:Uncharacterized protein n=1 Tax=Cryptococcus decagattii TaxID=1859122 RepID=A0ABZ2ALR9_9TREE
MKPEDWKLSGFQIGGAAGQRRQRLGTASTAIYILSELFGGSNFVYGQRGVERAIITILYFLRTQARKPTGDTLGTIIYLLRSYEETKGNLGLPVTSYDSRASKMRLTLPSILRGNVLAHPAYEKQYSNLCDIKGKLAEAENKRSRTISQCSYAT